MLVIQAFYYVFFKQLFLAMFDILQLVNQLGCFLNLISSGNLLKGLNCVPYLW